MKINWYKFLVVKRRIVNDKVYEDKRYIYKTSKHLRGAIRKLYATCDFDDIVSICEVA